MTNAYLAGRYPSPEGHYTDLQVLKSAAGWYIGTMFVHTSGDCEGLHEPGSRESDYYSTEEIAKEALEDGLWNQRYTP